ncbi:hypothetical protein EDB19DRAFT_1835062 [Suillus lakei]|nr:hypothetical protein EDB19DRAFT_1835062 [Suillus lakei]
MHLMWTLEDRMRSRTAFRRGSASSSLSRRSTMLDLEVLQAHYTRQHVHGEAYGWYERGESSPKRKRAIIGIHKVNKAAWGMLSNNRNGHRVFKGLVDFQIDIVDCKTVNVKGVSCIHSPGSSNSFTKRIVDGEVPKHDLGGPRIFEMALASKKMTDLRRRLRPMVDIVIAPQDLPAANHHLPRR